MLAAQRQELILERVQRSGAVRVTDLVASFAVSDMTIRRDLDALESRGAIRKVHGGAVASSGTSTEEPGFEAKSVRQEHEKHAIAREAARLVEPNTAVGLSAGTTTCTVAEYLRDVPGLTVVTNSPRVADVFYRTARSDQTVALTGGFRTPSDALVGPLAVSAVRSLHLDTLFLGVHGMQEQAGFTTPNIMEAETNKALVEATRTLVVVADHTKWGTVGLSTIAPLNRCDVLVTDAALNPRTHETLAEHVDSVRAVETEGTAEQAG